MIRIPGLPRCFREAVLFGLMLLLMGPAEAVYGQEAAQAASARLSFKHPSPYASLARTEQMLTAVALHLVLDLGYAEQPEAGGTWKTTGLSGLGLQRYFARPVLDTLTATLELAAGRNPGGGYDLYVYGEVHGRPNPDLPRVDSLMQALTEADLPPEGLVDLDYHLYTLSYTNADRVIGALKALGYHTVEYTEQDGTADEKIYQPVSGTTAPPVPFVVKLIDATKTSLLQPNPKAPPPPEEIIVEAVPDIGGTYLDQMTSGEPPQRLLLVYDRNVPEQRDGLLRLIRDTIDRPAYQVVIEALVVELNEDTARDLGVTFAGGGDEVSFDLSEDRSTGLVNPFVFNFDTSQPDFAFNFRARLSALVDEGAAEVLSNPSVLVLDGRQARIQVGQQVPITKQVVTEVGSFGSIDYLPVGIVLNLRPRVSEDRSEITMQVETIVSSIVQFTGQINVAQAPVIDNRRVQTFVRIFDNTPFIIGGLISTETLERRTGVPILSKIPLLGALFRKTVTATEKKEVIVVLTPHVIDLGEGSPSEVIPKDAAIFDSFDKTLFRNTYRVRRDDVFDLDFVDESVKVLRDTVAARAQRHPQIRRDPEFAEILAGGVPGEEVLVRRMLYEIIVEKLQYERHIDVDKMIFFGKRPDDEGLDVLDLKPYLDALPHLDTPNTPRNALALVFDTRPPTDAVALNPPAPTIEYHRIDSSITGYRRQLRALNTPGQTAILITEERLVPRLRLNTREHLDPLRQLKAVLVMKRLLDVNETLELTLRDFRPGRQIVFPDKQDLIERFHLVDNDAAQYFRDVFNYYGVFQARFVEEMNRLLQRLEDEYP